MGDDRGGVLSLKLSPNLRKVAKPPVLDEKEKKEESKVPQKSQRELEREKMVKLLESLDTKVEA